MNARVGPLHNYVSPFNGATSRLNSFPGCPCRMSTPFRLNQCRTCTQALRAPRHKPPAIGPHVDFAAALFRSRPNAIVDRLLKINTSTAICAVLPPGGAVTSPVRSACRNSISTPTRYCSTFSIFRVFLPSRVSASRPLLLLSP